MRETAADDRRVVPVGRPDAQAALAGRAARARRRTSRRPRSDLAQLTDASLTLLPQTDRTSRCARDVVLPTGDVVIHDEFDTGAANYKEFW